MLHVQMSYVACMNERYDALAWVKTQDMGWLRLVGSLKLQVSFAKEPYKRDCILQKDSYVVSRESYIKVWYGVSRMTQASAHEWAIWQA